MVGGMEAIQLSSVIDGKRISGIAIGFATQILFLFTVWHLYWFLQDGKVVERNLSLMWDAALALQFAIPHSILLLPSIKKGLTKFINPAFYGLMFSIVTCVSLLLAIRYWQGHPYEIWNLHGTLGWFMRGCFIASWFALYYSISLTGLGYQTGYTQWSYWLRGQPVPRREFQPRGAYHVLRHPVYLSFLGLIWFTPRMTLDHALLTGIWTVYIFVGSWLKDRRLTFYLGKTYREYAAEVPGYPLMPTKGLGRKFKYYLRHFNEGVKGQ